MGGSTSTQTTTNAPPKWAAPLLKQGAGDAQRLYNTGQGGNVYQGQRVADVSGQSTGGINGMNNAMNMYNSGAINRLATGATSSGTNLADMASGKMIGNNAAFNETLQNTLDRTATTINSQMSGAGRYGSGAHSDVMSNQLGHIAAQANSDQYNQDVRNMLTANGQIDSANQGQLNSLNSVYQGYSNASRNALTGGQVIDKNGQDKLNADWDKWSETDNRGWNRLNMLLGAATGSAGNYGTSTSKSKSSGFSLGFGNPLQSAGGLGASVLK